MMRKGMKLMNIGDKIFVVDLQSISLVDVSWVEKDIFSVNVLIGVDGTAFLKNVEQGYWVLRFQLQDKIGCEQQHEVWQVIVKEYYWLIMQKEHTYCYQKSERASHTDNYVWIV